jgi:hypothetical protein
MHKLTVLQRYGRIATQLATLGAISVSGFAFAQNNTVVAVPASIPLGSFAEIGVLGSTYGTGVFAAGSFMDDNFGIRFAADSAGKSEHLLGALGISVNNQGYLVVGGSSGKEPISGFDTKINGSSAFLRLDLTNLTPVMRKVFVEVINKKADGKTLSVADAPFTTVSTQDLGSVIRTTTVNGVVRTTISFSGGNSNSVSLGGEANVGNDGVLTIKLYHVRNDKGGDTSSKTHAWAGYKHYYPQHNANSSIGADTAGRLTVQAEKAIDGTGLGINLAGFKNTKGAKDYGVLFGLNYTFGGNTPNVGKRPDSNSMQLAETLKSFSTVSEHAVRNIEGLGKIVKTVETISSEKVNDVVKPNPNTAPTALSLAVLLSLTADMTASNQAVGKISCVDYSPSGAQNTCSFSGGSTNFAVAADGTVTYISGSVAKTASASLITPKVARTQEPTLLEGSYSVPVVATDAAGLTYNGTVSVVVGAQRTVPKFGINTSTLSGRCVQTAPVSEQLTYSSPSTGAVTWTSNNPTEVSVSSSGLVTINVVNAWAIITATQAATSTYKETSATILIGCD